MGRLTEKSIGCFGYELKELKGKPTKLDNYDTFYAYSVAMSKLGKLEDLLSKISIPQIQVLRGLVINELIIATGNIAQDKSYDDFLSEILIILDELEEKILL